MTDRMWLDIKCTLIQKYSRGVFGRKRYKALRREAHDNALIIQRCFRGFHARDMRNEALYARETREREEVLAMLAAEETYYDGRVELLERRIERRELEAKIAAAKARDAELHDAVLQHETFFVEMERQLANLSPRAIQQGFEEELKHHVAEHKEWITKYKAEALFDATLKLRELEDDYARRRKQVRNAHRVSEQFASWRESELHALWARESRRVHANAERGRRCASRPSRRWHVPSTRWASPTRSGRRGRRGSGRVQGLERDVSAAARPT